MERSFKRAFWIVVGLCAVAYMFGDAFWDELAKDEPSRISALRNFALFFAVPIGAVLALWRSLVAAAQAETAQTQAETARTQAEAAQTQAEAARIQAETAREQIEVQELGVFDRQFAMAVEMLGRNDDPTSRVAGIASLDLLARNHPDRYEEQVRRMFTARVISGRDGSSEYWDKGIREFNTKYGKYKGTREGYLAFMGLKRIEWKRKKEKGDSPPSSPLADDHDET